MPTLYISLSSREYDDDALATARDLSVYLSLGLTGLSNMPYKASDAGLSYIYRAMYAEF